MDKQNIDETIRKPRRSRGTPSYIYRNYFAFGVLSVAAISALIYSQLSTTVKIFKTVDEVSHLQGSEKEHFLHRTLKYKKRYLIENAQEQAAKENKVETSSYPKQTISKYFPPITPNKSGVEKEPGTTKKVPRSCLQNNLSDDHDDSVFECKSKIVKSAFQELLKSTKRATKKKVVRNNQVIGDTNEEHLRLAIALSRSSYEVENAGAEPLDEGEPAYPNTQEKVALVRKTLEQFGFQSKSSGSFKEPINPIPQRRGRKKFNCITPVLYLRTEEDRKRLIEEKVAQIFAPKTHLTSKNAPKEKPISFLLREYYDPESALFHKNGLSLQEIENNVFYNGLVDVSDAKVGGLLRDWHSIPGREKSPEPEVKEGPANRSDVDESIVSDAGVGNWDSIPAREKSPEVKEGMANMSDAVGKRHSVPEPEEDVMNMADDYIESSLIEEAVPPPSSDDDIKCRLSPISRPSLKRRSATLEPDSAKKMKQDISDDFVDLTQSSDGSDVSGPEKKDIRMADFTDNAVDPDHLNISNVLDIINNKNPNDTNGLNITNILSMINDEDDDTNFSRSKVNGRTVTDDIVDDDSQYSPELDCFDSGNNTEFYSSFHKTFISDSDGGGDGDDESKEIIRLHDGDLAEDGIEPNGRSDDVFDRSSTLRSNDNRQSVNESSTIETHTLSDSDDDANTSKPEENVKVEQSLRRYDEIDGSSDGKENAQNSNIRQSDSEDTEILSDDNADIATFLHKQVTGTPPRNSRLFETIGSSNYDEIDRLIDFGDEQVATQSKTDKSIVSYNNTFQSNEIILSDSDDDKENIRNGEIDKFIDSNDRRSDDDATSYIDSDEELRELPKADRKRQSVFDVEIEHLITEHDYGLHWDDGDHLNPADISLDNVKSVVNCSDSVNEILRVPNLWCEMETETSTPLRVTNINVQNSPRVVTPENFASDDNVIIRTRNVTPIEDYHKMDLQTLHRMLDGYGVRPLQKRKAVKLLKYVYNVTHPISEYGPNENPVVKEERGLPKRVSKQLIGPSATIAQTTDMHEKHLEKCDALNDSSDISVDEMIFERWRSKSILTCPIPLHIVWNNFLSNNPAYHEKILLYEPLEVEDTYTKLKQLGYKFHIEDLITFFDKKCINIKIEDKGRNNKNKRAKNNK